MTDKDYPPRSALYMAPELDIAKVATTATTLGILGTTALIYAPNTTFYRPLLYITLLCIFHFMEFWVTAKYNPTRVTTDSFLLNNGNAYTLAQIVSLIESTVLTVVLHGKLGYKLQLISLIGAAIAILGQVVRSMAMVQASKNFNHIVQRKKNDDHELVTAGIYQISRHPSYFGFFYWSLGLQLFMLNPFSFIAFSIVLWRFFNSRIQDEEKHLIKFFGEKYLDYKKNVSTKIPFIR